MVLKLAKKDLRMGKEEDSPQYLLQVPLTRLSASGASWGLLHPLGVRY